MDLVLVAVQLQRLGAELETCHVVAREQLARAAAARPGKRSQVAQELTVGLLLCAHPLLFAQARQQEVPNHEQAVERELVQDKASQPLQEE